MTVSFPQDARLYKDMGDFSSTRKIMDAVLEDSTSTELLKP